MRRHPPQRGLNKILSSKRAQPPRSASSSKGQARKESTPSVGFLLVDSSGAVLSANAEAVRILMYPELRDGHIEEALKAAIGALPAHDAPSAAMWSAVIVSGRRKYRCWGIPVERDNETQMAVVIERAVARQRALGTTRKESPLTPRERQTVTLLANGLTNKEIATRMGVSVNTITAFIRSVMLKLEVTTRAGIVGRAVFPS